MEKYYKYEHNGELCLKTFKFLSSKIVDWACFVTVKALLWFYYFRVDTPYYWFREVGL